MVNSWIMQIATQTGNVEHSSLANCGHGQYMPGSRLELLLGMGNKREYVEFGTYFSTKRGW